MRSEFNTGYANFRALQNKLEVSPQVLGARLGIAARTLDRRLQSQSLSELEMYKAEAIVLTLQKAEEVFGDLGQARAWMHAKLPALEFKTPFEVVVTPSGYEQVRTILGRILAGTF
jgi:putative toxin-antitoxin system antitoxin component (TIGR02293 family)